MIAHALFALQAAVAQASLPSVEPVFASGEVVDSVLAEQRGGFRLPNGIEVSLSIDTITALDGAIVLRTVTRISDGAPVTKVYAPSTGQTVPFAGSAGAGVVRNYPSVTYDRQYGLTIAGGGTTLPVTLASGEGPADQVVAGGLQQIDSSTPVVTSNGKIQTSELGVALLAPDIGVVHLNGRAFGTAIANSGSDRTIDTMTVLSIDLRNAGPDVLGSTMLRIEGITIDAMAGRY